jgi:hypothetical protein
VPRRIDAVVGGSRSCEPELQREPTLGDGPVAESLEDAGQEAIEHQELPEAVDGNGARSCGGPDPPLRSVLERFGARVATNVHDVLDCLTCRGPRRA